MREIKFRAWHKNQRKMFRPRALWLNNPKDAVWINEPDCFELWGYVGDSVELMQYTGLKDKNGKEIYEGDIIKFDYYRKPCILPVAWGVDGWWAKGIGWFKGLYDVAGRCEVIGNIYENPELTEGSKQGHGNKLKEDETTE